MYRAPCLGIRKWIEIWNAPIPLLILLWCLTLTVVSGSHSRERDNEHATFAQTCATDSCLAILATNTEDIRGRLTAEAKKEGDRMKNLI